MIARADVSGLVLAGGAGSRMGGDDKGLRPFRGLALAEHAARRLRPQVSELLLSVNRHRDIYASFGHRLVFDQAGDPATRDQSIFAGPLSGILAGLRACTTDWLVVVPCDAPLFPLDLVAKLGSAVEGSGRLAAVAVCTLPDGSTAVQPTFCLLAAASTPHLAEAVATGERKVGRWLQSQHAVPVAFGEAAAFANANTASELAALEHVG